MDDRTKSKLFALFPEHAKLYLRRNESPYIINDFVNWLCAHGYSIMINGAPEEHISPGDIDDYDKVIENYLKLDNAALKIEKEKLKQEIAKSEHHTFCLRQLQAHENIEK